MPADTTDILKFSLFLPLLQINSVLMPRLDEEVFNFFFSVTYCQATDRRSVVGEHRRKVWKGSGQNYINEKELFQLHKSVKLKTL